MSQANKELVKQFYYSDFYKNENVYKDFVHEDLTIDWNSSTGFLTLDYHQFKDMLQEMSKSFRQMNPEISHIMAEEDEVCIRFSYHVESIESDEIIPLADFICIWKIKDGKLFKGHFISHPSDETSEGIHSFLPN
ncbi:MAG: nuclear transport factor 2 family protein [Bacteroidota bacterium]